MLRRPPDFAQAAGVAVVHEPAAVVEVAEVASGDGHLEGVEDEVGAEVIGDLPADDRPRVHVEDERHIQPARPRRHVRDVGDPQLVGSLRDEVAVDEVWGPVRAVVGDGRVALLASDHATDAHLGHQPLHGAPGDRVPLAAEFLVDPPGPVAGVVRDPRRADLDLVDLVGDRPSRRRPDLAGIERPLTQADRRAHRRDRPTVPVLIDEPGHHLDRGSASLAKVGRRRLEDLDRALLVGHLLAQLLDLRELLGRRTHLEAPIHACLLHPAPKRLRRTDPQIAGNVRDLAAPVDHLLDRSTPQLVAVLARSAHDSSLLSPDAHAQESALHQTWDGSVVRDR